MKDIGEQFIHQKDPRLHTSGPVKHEAARRKRRGIETSQNPADAENLVSIYKKV